MGIAFGNAYATEATQDYRIVAFGDSLTAGYQLGPQEGFAPVLEASLRAAGHAVRVIDAGVSGDTTAGGVRRLNNILALRPDAVILELGANDALRGLPPEDAQKNLGYILQNLKAAKVRVLLTGMKAPRNLGADYTQSFDQIYPALAKQHGVMLYPFFLDGVALEPSLNLPDGIHPNAEGVRVVVENILPHVERLIEAE